MLKPVQALLHLGCAVLLPVYPGVLCHLVEVHR
jgi:hypothetical protein